MLWIKALHVIFMVTWFAGLFYLPRIFVYHAMSDEAQIEQRQTFMVMERKLLLMTHIGAALTLLFGTWLLLLWLPDLVKTAWMQIKLVAVFCVIVYHIWLVKLVADFKHNRNHRSHRWYRIFNEIPVLFLFCIIVMVIVRPIW